MREISMYVAKIKKGKPQAYWDDELSALTEKRNRVMRDAINKTARFVVNYCLTNKIGKEENYHVAIALPLLGQTLLDGPSQLFPHG